VERPTGLVAQSLTHLIGPTVTIPNLERAERLTEQALEHVELLNVLEAICAPNRHHKGTAVAREGVDSERRCAPPEHRLVARALDEYTPLVLDQRRGVNVVDCARGLQNSERGHFRRDE
jgi:hypothetical protein